MKQRLRRFLRERPVLWSRPPSWIRRRRGPLVATFALLCAAQGSTGCHGEEVQPPTLQEYTDDTPPGVISVGRTELVPRTPELVTYPCTDACHLEPTISDGLALERFHTFREIRHGPALHQCSTCHYVEDMNRLRLFDGTSIDFDESPQICGQCHGEKMRDWLAGIHGLQTGSWNGARQRRACPACHNPHAPTRMRLEAMPAPNPRGYEAHTGEHQE
ncbi:MAG: hypothetical protein OEY14_11055 [Myxococcales bacterium]|nr:hypothetical protein [Myxococcales bacterium]